MYTRFFVIVALFSVFHFAKGVNSENDLKLEFDNFGNSCF